VIKGWGKWKKTSVYHREPSGTQVEEIQDLTRKSERLEKGEAKNRYNAERYIEARFVPWIEQKPGMLPSPPEKPNPLSKVAGESTRSQAQTKEGFLLTFC
jgi:hypothetical protein